MYFMRFHTSRLLLTNPVQFLNSVDMLSNQIYWCLQIKSGGNMDIFSILMYIKDPDDIHIFS